MVSSLTFALAFVQFFIIFTTVSLTTFVTAMESFGSSDSTGLPDASQSHTWAPQLKESWFHANRVSQRQDASDGGGDNALKAFYEAKAQHDQLMGSRDNAAHSSSNEHSREKVSYDHALQPLQEWELVDDESTMEKHLRSAGKVPKIKKTSSSSRRKKAMEKQMQRLRRIEEDDEEATA